MLNRPYAHIVTLETKMLSEWLAEPDIYVGHLVRVSWDSNHQVWRPINV